MAIILQNWLTPAATCWISFAEFSKIRRLALSRASGKEAAMWRTRQGIKQRCGANFRNRRNVALWSLNRSCSENCIPDCGRRFAVEAKLSEFELTFSDPMHQFDAGDGDRGASKPLQSKHRTQPKFDRSVILFNAVIIWHV
jgi:hypothetical protein